MHEEGRVVGLGLGLVDCKAVNPNIVLPQNKADLIRYLDQQGHHFSTERGGSTANVLYAYSVFLDTRTKLFYSLGQDRRGEFFRRSTAQRLGEPQIQKGKNTGVCVFVFDENRHIVDFLSSYEAAEEVVVGKDEIKDNKNNLFVTDIFTLKCPSLAQQSGIIFDSLEEDHGIFALSLSGASQRSVKRDVLLGILSSFKRTPEIVFANKDELLYLRNGGALEDAVRKEFGDARLMVVTNGENGSYVRFEGKVFEIPPFNIPSSTVLDETGAGDAYMGIMLGALFNASFGEWDINHVLKAASTASFAASLVTQGINSRLTKDQINQAKKFYLSFRVPDL